MFLTSYQLIIFLQEIRSEELHNDVCQVLHGYKQVSNASNPCLCNFYVNRGLWNEENRKLIHCSFDKNNLTDAEEWCMGPMHVSFGAPCKRQAVKISSIILFLVFLPAVFYSSSVLWSVGAVSVLLPLVIVHCQMILELNFLKQKVSFGHKFLRHSFFVALIIKAWSWYPLQTFNWKQAEVWMWICCTGVQLFKLWESMILIVLWFKDG